MPGRIWPGSISMDTAISCVLNHATTETHVALSMADDIAFCLLNASQLMHLKPLLAVHERASNALNNWLKTFGLCIGSEHGSTFLPDGWNPAHVNFSDDPAIQYLGNFFGPPSCVLAEWIKPAGPSDNSLSTDLTSCMAHCFAQWSALGVGPTYAGRNLVTKNSVLSMAWYLRPQAAGRHEGHAERPDPRREASAFGVELLTRPPKPKINPVACYERAVQKKNATCTPVHPPDVEV